MVYGLPADGEANWGAKVNASIAAVKATADAAQVAANLEADVAGKIGDGGALDSALSASFDRKTRVDISDFITSTAGGVNTVDFAAAIQAVEERDGWLYLPPGDWWPEDYNIALDNANVPALGGTTASRHTYVIKGAGKQSRIRLHADMTSSDYLFKVNSAGATDFNAHPKVVIEDLAVVGPATNHLGNFMYLNQRSLAVSRVYLAAMRTAFYTTGYCDFVRLDHVYAEAMTTADPNGWLLNHTGNGDSIVARQVFAYGSNGLRVRGATGMVMEECLSGFHEFESCVVELRNNHCEGDGSTSATPMFKIKGSVVSVRGGFYQTKPYRATFDIDDSSNPTFHSRVKFERDVMFAVRLDESGAALGNVHGVDVKITSLGKKGLVEFENTRAYLFAQSTAKASGGNGFGTNGIKALRVTSADSAIATALANKNVLLAEHSELRWENGSWAVWPKGRTDYNTKSWPVVTPTLSNASDFNAYMTGTLTPGTYYYRVWVRDNAARSNDVGTEVNITTTSDNPLVALAFALPSEPVAVRILRGTSAGTYTQYAEVVVGAAEQTLVDSGDAIAGVAWSAYSGTPAYTSAGGSGATRRGLEFIDANTAVLLSGAAPTAGTWRKGDRVFNTNASVGSPQGWVCTTAGTPGTWTALPNL